MKHTDDQLLDALWAVSGHGEFVDADTVSRKLAGRDVWARPSVIGIGRKLSRLAREGRCEAQYDYMGRYRLVRR